MIAKLYFLALFFISFSSNAKTNHPDTKTIDGTPVEFFAINEDEMAVSHQSVAYALYNKEGAFIFYDKGLFAKLEKLSKFLIIEHERAHHYLGHTLSTKGYRERKEIIPARLSYIKETDADCESGYRAREVYGDKLTSLEINTALRSIYLKQGGNPKKYPEWLSRRIGKVTTCFEALIPRPGVLVE